MSKFLYLDPRKWRNREMLIVWIVPGILYTMFIIINHAKTNKFLMEGSVESFLDYTNSAGSIKCKIWIRTSAGLLETGLDGKCPTVIYKAYPVFITASRGRLTGEVLVMYGSIRKIVPPYPLLEN